MALVVLCAAMGCADDGAEESEAPEPQENITEPRQQEDLPGGSEPVGIDPCEPGDATCYWRAVGLGTERPLEGEELRGQPLVEDGVLRPQATVQEYPVVWIANAGNDTVSRIHAESFVETGRYRSGPSDIAAHEPTSLATASDGSVFILNKASESIAHIGLAPFCPRQSGQEELRTSDGRDDLKDFGGDDCLLWHQSLSGHGALTALVLDDSLGDSPSLWIASEQGALWKVNPDNGNDLFRTDLPIGPTSMTLDGDGRLWMIEDGEDALAMVDTARCSDHSSCDVEVCDGYDSDCIKSIIDTPSTPRDLMVDDDDAIWIAGDLARFEPQAPPSEQWSEYGRPQSRPIYGLAHDGDDWIYGAADDDGVFRINAADPDETLSISGTSGRSIRSIHIDTQERVWAISSANNDATIIDPGPGPFDASVVDRVAGLNAPSANGHIAARHVDIPDSQHAAVRAIFEGCPPTDYHFNEWQTLRFDAHLPASTLIEWRVRGAEFEESLGGRSWHYAGHFSDEATAIDLKALLSPDGEDTSRFIEVEARLYPGLDGEEPVIPELSIFDTVSFCAPIFL